MFEMIPGPIKGRAPLRSISPLACDVHPAVYLESYISVVWRRPTSPTGWRYDLVTFTTHNPVPLRQKRSIGVSVCSCNLLCWKASAPAPWDKGVPLHHGHDFEGFFRPGFWLVVTYIREQCCAFWRQRSPRIGVTLRLAPDVDGPSCDSDDPARRCWFARRGSSSFVCPPQFWCTPALSRDGKWQQEVTADHEWYISLSNGNWINAHLQHTLCIKMKQIRGFGTGCTIPEVAPVNRCLGQ